MHDRNRHDDLGVTLLDRHLLKVHETIAFISGPICEYPALRDLCVGVAAGTGAIPDKVKTEEGEGTPIEYKKRDDEKESLLDKKKKND